MLGEPRRAVFPTGEVEMIDHFLEVAKLPSREVVTTIEVLSPANKRGEMREDYLAKRERARRAGSHYVEIGPAGSAGRRSEPEHAMPAVGEGYCTVVSRRESYPTLLIYDWPRGAAMPPVPVPLRSPDADVVLELVPLVDAVYDDGRYDELLPDEGEIADAAR